MDFDAILDLIFSIGIPVAVIALGFWIGRTREKRHLASLDQREQELRGIRLDTFKRMPSSVSPEPAPALVCGEVTIASDAFKTWASHLRNIFGGEARNFTRLCHRARREAALRMMETARAQGYNAICNVRYSSADIGGNAVTSPKQNKPMACCLVSGTAYLAKQE